MNAPFLPDGSWADPLDRAERRELARSFARGCRRFAEVAQACEPGCGARRKALAIATELGDLHMDVTERAVALPRENRT